MSVIEVYRTFMHREPDRQFVINLPGCNVPRQLALLGKLRELIGSKSGVEFNLSWSSRDGALLLCTADNVLYGYDPYGALMSFYCERVLYECDKGRGNHVYEHTFSKPPWLSIVPRSKGMLARFTSGAYRIESEGITG